MDINIEYNNVDDLFEQIDAFLENAEENQYGFVKFASPHAIYVEYPTEYQDKKPPLQPLLDWVERNIVTDNPKETAFRIQQHIYENGTEGIFFLNRTKAEHKQSKINTIIDEYNGDVENAPENIMTEILESILSQSENIIEDENKIDTGELINSGLYELNAEDELVA